MKVNNISLSTVLIIYFLHKNKHYVNDNLEYLSKQCNSGSKSVIFQVAGFSFILAIFIILIISDRYIKNMRFWLRLILLFISAIIIFSTFAVIFKWFPVNDLLAWLGFLVSAFICFVFSLGLTFIKFKIEQKKYNTLLENYKKTHNS